MTGNSHQKSRRVTIKDLARELNLSVGAVSQALNPRESTIKLRPQTAERVRHMARKMNYRPHAGASSIRSRYFRNIGYFVAKQAGSWVEPLLYQVGLHDAAMENNFRLSLVHLPSESAKTREAIPRVFQESHLDALVVTHYGRLTERYRTVLEEAGFPVIYLNDRREKNSIYIDDFYGGRNVTEHLIACGCKRIVFFNEPGELLLAQNSEIHYSNADRELGYLEAMKTAGLKPEIRKAAVHHGPVNMKDYDWLLESDRPDGIVCYNDSFAVFLMIQLYQKNIRIPDEIMITGYNDDPIANDQMVPLTTMKIPAYQMAKEAFSLAYKVIQSDNHEAVESVSFKPELCIRKSSVLC